MPATNNTLTISRLPLLIFGCALLLLLSTPWLARPSAGGPAPLPKPDKYDRVDLAIQHEVAKTRDPRLGTVPRARLLRAYAVAEQKRRTAPATRAAIPDLSWRERGPDDVAGRVRAILIDASDPSYQTVWAAGVSGGLWQSTQIGADPPQWQPVDDFFDNLAITSLAQDPSNPDVLYFGTGEGFYNSDAVRGLGIWKSTDHGQTWSQLTSTTGSDFSYVQKLVVTANGDLFACTRHAGVQRSTDGGLSWTKVLGAGVNGGLHDVAADLELAANGDLWAGLGLIFSPGALYHSTDGGNTWSQALLPGGSFQRIEVACAPSDPDRVYALTQHPTTRACRNIFRSDDGGLSWTATTNPNIVHPGPDTTNFCRSQAWYDLIAAVDPNDPDRIFIGGIDLLVSHNAGQSWTNVSSWWGGNGLGYVHADQHALVFEPGNSSVLLAGNDGGLWRSTNATAFRPAFQARNRGLNITQYYAADYAPQARSQEFLAGAQDNGTQRHQGPGLSQTDEVTSGDGGFCHIDADEPGVQVSSYIFNTYRVTTDGWANFTRYDYSLSAGRFINPTDYDDLHDRLYACHAPGQYLRLDGIGNGQPVDQLVTVAAFGGAQLSAVKVSPNVAHRVFFGLDNGRIVRIDNAHLGSSATGLLLNAAAGMPVGYISSLDVEKGNDDHLLVTYSNYGLNSVWETTDGGSTWRSLEGDLPDMPVRWGMLHPFDANQALLATELGVWTCNNLGEATPDWGPSNDGLANVRTDMLRFRASDSLLVAATHGRGLFTSEVFRAVRVRFQTDQLALAEGQTDGLSGTCRPYRDYQVAVEISRPSPVPVQVTASVSGGGATPDDYDLPHGALLTFPADDGANQYLTLRLYDDGQPELGESLQLTLTPVGGTQVEAPHTLTIDLHDRDPDLTQLGVVQFDTLLFEDFEGGALPPGWTLDHGGTNSDDFQFGTAATRSSPGWTIPTAGNSSQIAATNDDACACNKSQDRLITPVMDWSLASNISLNFDAFFDGQIFSTGYRVSTDGGTTWSSLTPIGPNANWQHVTYSLNGYSGEATVRLAFEFSDWGSSAGRGLALDNVRLTADRALRVLPATQLSASDTHELGPFATVHFYDDQQQLLATLENLSSADFGCTTVEIDRAGTGSSDFWDALDDGGDLADKTLRITPTLTPANSQYRITLYYRPEEVAGWEAATGKSWASVARIVKSGGAISQVTPATPYPAGPIEQAVDAVSSFGPGGDYAISATFSSGFSGFGVGDPDSGTPFPVDWLGLRATLVGEQVALQWTVGPEVNLSHYEVLRRNAVGRFEPLGRVTAAGQPQYRWQDERPRPGRNQYRIRSVDLDGQQSTSPLASVQLPLDRQAYAWPNPFAHNLRIALPAAASGTVQVQVYGPAGRCVWRGVGQPGQTLSIDNQPGWSSGMYLLHLHAPGLAPQVIKLTRI